MFQILMSVLILTDSVLITVTIRMEVITVPAVTDIIWTLITKLASVSLNELLTVEKDILFK